MKKKIIVAVTGGIGSGKSTVAKMLQRLGAQVIDADHIAHQALRPRTSAYRQIVKVFGEGILKRDAAIDREHLAKIVFAKSHLLRQLNALTHPWILKTIKRKIQASTKNVVVLDVPLLIETGLQAKADVVVVVSVDASTQVTRIQAKTSLGKTEIYRRIKCQMPLKDKVRRADFVIDNNGSLAKTRLQVNRLWKMVRVMQGGCSGKT